MSELRVILKKGKEESLKRFHPWIFSGAIARLETSDKNNVNTESVSDGETVAVYSSDKTFLARGHCSMGSIAVRVLTFTDEAISLEWWQKRIIDAYNTRKVLSLVDNSSTSCYRLIHGEGDMLPGLVVDIYGTVAVVQCHSTGMYLSRTEITKALKSVYGEKLTTIYDKSSGTLPKYTDLDPVDSILWGEKIASATVFENGLKFDVNWAEGQKTGFFIDQRDNRSLVRSYSQNRRVLNTFCYTGGFSVYALAGGAVSVDSVDSSAKAVELANKNIELNFGEKAPHKGIAVDAFEFLKEVKPDSYDLIILDPPAFAKHHRVLGNALQGYKRLNAEALRKIAPGGILFTFSCSQAVSTEQFRLALFSAAAIAGREIRIINQLHQPADHPINIYHPESEYLKGFVVYVS